MGLHVNSTNYNKSARTPSIHYGRTNVAKRFEANAAAKAASTPVSYDTVYMMAAPPTQHKSFGEKLLQGVQSFFSSFGTGYSLGSGNNNMMACNYMNGGMLNGCSSNMYSMNGSIMMNRGGFC